MAGHRERRRLNVDKPTCATCPYWVHTETADEFTTLGECMRYPPKLLPSYTDDLDSDIQRQWQFAAGPIVSDDCFCGEHPDFPAFLESRKVPPPSEPSDLEIDGDVTVTRQQFDAVARVIYSHSFHASPRPTPPTAPPSSPPTPRE